MKTLQSNQPELCINANDVLSVKIAALCHDLGIYVYFLFIPLADGIDLNDTTLPSHHHPILLTCIHISIYLKLPLGHGPFSHVYDGEFIRKILPGRNYRHEDNSIKILDYLIKENDIRLHEYGLVEEDKIFIDEVIRGTREPQRKGRKPSKFFLYDIVNNSRSGLDVDKLDYFQRDTFMTNVMGGSLTLEVARFLDEGKVMKAYPISNSSNSKGKSSGDQVDQTKNDNFPLMLCYPSKLVHSAVSLFAARYQMHQKVYTHKAVKQIEFMVTDVMMLANDEIRIPGSKTEKHPDGMYTLSDCIECPKAFCYLKDSILDIIEFEAERNPGSDKLRRAKALIERIRKRSLYKCVGKCTFFAAENPIVTNTTDQEILEEIVELSRKKDLPDENPATPIRLTPSSSYNNVGNCEDGLFSPRIEFGSPLQTSQPPTAGYFPPPSQEDSCSLSQEASLPLEKTDLIVDKMHLHHGMKADNPVSRLRFFGKYGDENQIAQRIPEKVYHTILPRCFEERAIRVFCRKPVKEKKVKEAFDAWCKKRNVQLCDHELSAVSAASSD